MSTTVWASVFLLFVVRALFGYVRLRRLQARNPSEYERRYGR
jgi:hypothetical protein